MAAETGMSEASMRRLLDEDLQMKPFKMRKTQMLNPNLRAARKQKCRTLLQRFTPENVDHILFSDEKIFNVEAKWNSQNGRVYATDVHALPAGANQMQRTLHPASVMVWAGVSAFGKTSLVFVDQGVKIRKENYVSDILVPHVLPLTQTMFNNNIWWFQQDSAPAHKANFTQTWCRDHLPGFISSSEWPAGSPDLNPLDYFVWSKLEQMACRKNHPSVPSLKRALLKAWEELPMEEVHNSIHGWRKRLTACVRAQGGHFES
jgi:inhibitor of nuclear factor kappa-B kinase subunit alpha